MSKKIYFSTTEIIPFANVSSIAGFSTHIPTKLQELGHDIRTILPKYGFISERKYILREVIRLRQIPFEFCTMTHMPDMVNASVSQNWVRKSCPSWKL